VGAVFPIFPYFFWSGAQAIYISLAVSAVGLFIIGAAITLMTGRSVLFSGTRQVVVGIIAAALTYGIGRLIGGSVA
jgi:VIT1/CCC1 family predicted Fe2+/Mn2+ transporter